MTSPFAFEALADQDRSRFSSGTEALDRYFRTQAGQDVRRRMATCCIAVEGETREVVGFYTVAMSAVPLLDLPEALGRKLPRYPQVPAPLLGRLAVDLRFRGRGVGGAMVSDALERTRGSGVRLRLGRRRQGRCGGLFLSTSWLCRACRKTYVHPPGG